MHEPGLLQQAFVYLLAGVVAVPLARRLGMGSILGAVVAAFMLSVIAAFVGDYIGSSWSLTTTFLALPLLARQEPLK